MSNSKNPNIVPTFLQPNTVRSSRAAIFDDDFDQRQHSSHQSKPKHSNRPGFSRRNQDQDDFEVDGSEDDGNDQQSKSILERLYGQLQGAIEIEDTAMTTPVSGADPKQRIDDDSDKSEIDEEEQQQQQNQDEDEGMEFRLFASDDTPTAIILNAKEPEIIYVHRERPPLDESPGSERMRQITEAAIDAKTILEQSHIPWARSFFEHKVIHVPFKQEAGTDKVRKSKRKREWEKKAKAGLIDQATINATARKIKVSDSWGPLYTIRHGLDRNTIDPGTHLSKESYSSRGGRGGRGGARGGGGGGRGGSGRGRGRGGGATSTGTTREGHAEKSDRRTGDSDNKKEVSTDRPAKVTSTDSAAKETPGDYKVKSKSEPTTAATTPDATKKPLSAPPKKRTANAEALAKPESGGGGTTTLPRPPKKPKANNKPMSKLDNIMAMLTGK
ncbi:hypothetical protein BGW39_001356 [Mortierella sp. 14UC]|nr:hypothetical protein BGW39_001356 [Mortierella sp. 14UC]